MNIVIVDDDRIHRTVLRVELTRAGHRVIEVQPSSVLDVLAILREQGPDLLVADYEMPHCNGESLIRAVREDPVLKDMRILMVSAHCDPELVERLGRWDLCGYLVKPFSPEALAAVLKHC